VLGSVRGDPMEESHVHDVTRVIQIAIAAAFLLGALGGA